MIEIDKGHSYGLLRLDAGRDEHFILRFVKRVGPRYPGNEDSYPGTIIQEVLRACIARLKYLHGQKPHWINPVCVDLLRACLILLEMRAAEQHGVKFINDVPEIELTQVNLLNGHIGWRDDASVTR